MTSRTVRSRAEQLAAYERVREARSLDVTPERLGELALDDVLPVRLWTARSRVATPGVLAVLAADEDGTVRWNVMLSLRSDDAVLRALAQRERGEAGGAGTSSPACTSSITPTPRQPYGQN